MENKIVHGILFIILGVVMLFSYFIDPSPFYLIVTAVFLLISLIPGIYLVYSKKGVKSTPLIVMLIALLVIVLSRFFLPDYDGFISGFALVSFYALIVYIIGLILFIVNQIRK